MNALDVAPSDGDERLIDSLGISDGTCQYHTVCYNRREDMIHLGNQANHIVVVCGSWQIKEDEDSSSTLEEAGETLSAVRTTHNQPDRMEYTSPDQESYGRQ